MTQLKNTEFYGAGFYEVEPRSHTGKLTTKNLVGDNALNFGLGKTGESGSGPNEVILDHSGNGSGCLLGFPLCNDVKQGFYSRQYLTPNCVWGSPIFIPKGETSIYVEINTQNSAATHRARVTALPPQVLSPGVALSLQPGSTGAGPPVLMSTPPGAGSHLLGTSVHVGTNTTGLLMFLTIELDSNNDSTGNSMFAEYHSFSVHFNRGPSSNIGLMGNIARDGDLFKCLTDEVVEADGTATVNQEKEIDELLVQNNQPLNGWLVSNMNMQTNALMEYVTGSPAGTNEDLTLESSEKTVPDRSAFYDHAEGGNNGYENIQIPIAACGVGHFLATYDAFENSSGAMPIGQSATGASGGNIVLNDLSFYVPDMLLGGASTEARVTAVFIATQANTAADPLGVEISVRSYNSGGTASTTESVTLVVEGEGLYFATIPVRLWRDRFNRFRILYDVDGNYKSGGSFSAAFALVGYCVYSFPILTP
jgi:hypothetical protein